MVELSVGQVSGFIAAAVFVLQLILPLAFSAALVAFLSDENSVATWSSLGRYLQSTPWPFILRSDAATVQGVSRRVNLAAWLPNAALFLVSIASIITPLGLYESVRPSNEHISVPFTYLTDGSAFGIGTPNRPNAFYSRSCGTEIPCPGSWISRDCHMQGLLENCTVEYSNSLPQGYIDYFKDGAQKMGSSVSSMFDIQWRSYVNATDAYSNMRWFLRADFRQLSLLILDEKIELVEGLIVDMQSGGVGFRNHTAPSQKLEYGSIWTEDILFVQPETQCVGLNLTLDFKLPLDGTSWNYVEELSITDRGGFSGLSRTSPNTTTGPNGQHNLDLRGRAYNAAWVNNFLTMVYFNATDPNSTNITRVDVEKGDSFGLPSGFNSTIFRIGHRSVATNPAYGDFLNLTNYSNFNESKASRKNPFNVKLDDFYRITERCSGSKYNTIGNINSSVVLCSLLYGAANRTDGGSSLVHDPGSSWSAPIYSCASSVKATIREVAFKYNGTGLGSLTVVDAAPKEYSTDSSLPVWGVEDMKTIELQQGSPGWGVLGAANSTNDKHPYNITSITKGSLYLPGFYDQYSDLLNGRLPVPNTRQNFPASDFYTQALASAGMIQRPNSKGFQGFQDYSGQTSVALFSKWQGLSSSPDGAAKIINLVWTDIAANSVVGTRGWGLSPPEFRNFTEPEQARRLLKRDEDNSAPSKYFPVTVYEKAIRYKMWYSIPAIIVLAIGALIFGLVASLAITGKTSPQKMRHFLDITSLGRVIAVSLWPEQNGMAAGPEWLARVRPKRVQVTNEGLFPETHGLMKRHTERPKGSDDDAISLLAMGPK